MSFGNRKFTVSAKVIDRFKLGQQITGRHHGFTLGLWELLKFGSKLQLKLGAHLVAVLGALKVDAGMPGRIGQRCPKDRTNPLVKSKPHRNKLFNAMSERSLADCVDPSEFGPDFVVSLDSGFEELARVGKVAIQRTQRQPGSGSRLLDGREHCVFGEHFEHDIDNRIDIAFSSGHPSIDRFVHLECIRNIGHCPSTVASGLRGQRVRHHQKVESTHG